MIGALQRKRSLGRMGDEELMELVVAGDHGAFEAVYDRHGGAAYSLAFRICGRGTLAEEVTQDALLSVWRRGLVYRPDRGSLRSWLLTIVHHRAIDAVRRAAVHDRRRTDEELEDRHEAPERTEHEASRREEARAVRGALATLSSEQRRVVELAYFGGLTHTEISDVLQLPLGTVKGRMRLALEKLRSELEGQAA